MDDLSFPESWKQPEPTLEFASASFKVRRVRKKPVEVEAATATTDNLSEMVDWIKGHGHAAVLGNGQLIIQTLEGPFTVRPGDEVIRGVQGEFYRCDPGIYKQSYDEVE